MIDPFHRNFVRGPQLLRNRYGNYVRGKGIEAKIACEGQVAISREWAEALLLFLSEALHTSEIWSRNTSVKKFFPWQFWADTLSFAKNLKMAKLCV